MSFLSTRPAPWCVLMAAVGLAAPILLLAGGGGAANAAVPAAPAGWTTVFSDDFTGSSGTGVNSVNWLYDTGIGYPGGATNWGTGEIETMTSSTANVYHDGAGHLVIKPIRDGSGNWTSGRIETQRTDLAAPAGGILRIEGSIQQPNVNTSNGAGYWPAFWTLGAAARPVGATNWPSIGEWDIMENINGRPSVFSTLHCGTVSGGPCNETTGIGSGEHACGGCNSSFHTYAVEYDRSVSPEQMRFYLDGSNYHTVTATQVGAATWAAATQHGMFIILNVAIGGGFPAAFGGGPNAATVSGVPMLVDYVAAYTKPGSTSGGGSAPSVPTGFTIAGTTSTSVSLRWNAVSGATSYNILRAGIKIASTTNTTFTDSRLNPRTPYIYSVQAVNAAGTSAATGELTVTTPA
ncbi:MAG TPA: family 16 glycosylhydrolase [Kineosporiaceae bacterium]|nr:family 16 glycosylhydrolase [Kineosporiaceae bacterium]